MASKSLKSITAAARRNLWAAASLFLIAMLGEMVIPLLHAADGRLGGELTNASYVLGPNDLIRVAVYREPDLTTETRVDQDGTVSLPLIQGVKLGGKSIAEANLRIKELYEQDFLRSAGVMVTVLQTARTNAVLAKKVTVSGEVKKPGVIELPPGQVISLVEAIALAGDFSRLANQEKVTVKRMVSGEEKVFQVDVKSMMRDAKAKPFPVLPGDVIVVKETLF